MDVEEWEYSREKERKIVKGAGSREERTLPLFASLASTNAQNYPPLEWFPAPHPILNTTATRKIGRKKIFQGFESAGVAQNPTLPLTKA
jgi:hypothetical protein